MKSIKLNSIQTLVAIVFVFCAQYTFAQCPTPNYIVKSSGPTTTTCSQLFDNGTWGNFGGSGTSYYALYNGGPTSNPKFGFNVASQGGYGSVTIQGGGGINYPTLGFSFTNSTGTPIMGAILDGVETNTTAGSEAMDLAFYTKANTTSTTTALEKMRLTSLGKLGVGLTNPIGKVDIYKAALGTETQSIGLNVHNADLTTGSTINGGTGISVLADNSSAGGNVGAQITASNGSALNMGVWSTASGPGTSGTNFGVIGSASGNMVNYGIYGSIASGIHPNNCAGYFNGDVFTTGTYNTSDEKLKTNAQDFKDALTLLKKLEPKSYSYKTDEYKDVLNLPEGMQIGIMAQNIQAVFPNLVKEKVASPLPDLNKAKSPDVKFLAVNYVGLVPVLVQAVKELSSDLEQTKKDNADLRQLLNDICNSGCASLKGTNTADPSTTAPNQLLQNVPNPFAGQTTVNYVLNSGTAAYLNVNALDGKQIKQIPLTVKGQGSVTINGSELGSGTYTYTLYVDGTAIDTKLMVIANK